MSNNYRSIAKNIELTAYEDLFEADESRADLKREKILEVPLTELFPFTQHLFRCNEQY